MSDLFKSAGGIASKITNVYSLAALALVLFHFSLYFMPSLDPTLKTWLLSGSLLAAVAMLLILRAKPQAIETLTEEHRLFTAIGALIDSSNVPMYLTDDKLIVLRCNESLAQLFDSTRSALTGCHLNELVKRMSVRVPKSRPRAFLARQGTLVGKIASDLTPHSEDSEIIDNYDLPGNSFQGRYKVWIHADKISIVPHGRVIGLFVFYHLDPVSRQEGEET